MVKFGKNKIKALNKLAKKLNNSSPIGSNFNKVLKKKQNTEKKVKFQKDLMLKETANSALVKNVTAKEIFNESSQGSAKRRTVKPKDEIALRKQKSVEKQKKRQKTQINDTKLLLNLIKKK